MDIKLNRLSKILITIIIFISILLVLSTVLDASSAVIYGGDDGKNPITLSPGLTFRLRGATLFDLNPNLYCVERGKKIPDEVLRYMCSDEIVINDPLFAYILNLPDDSKTMATNTSTCVKQNLIWWYMQDDNGIDTMEKRAIKAIGTNHGSSNPYMTDSSTNKNSQGFTFAQLKQKAQEYANNYNTSSSISITSMAMSGNNVIVNVSGTYKKYRVYINNNQYYGEYSSSSISIPISSFSGGTAQVKVVGVREKYKASVYVLRKDNSQKFMVVFNQGTIDEDFGSATKDLPINTDVSLQKYISEVNGKSLVDTYNSGDKYIVDQTGYSTENITKADNNNGQSMLLQRWAKNATFSSNSNICTSNGGSRAVGYVHEDYRSNNYYKINRPVNIEKGDIVTYTIDVYNNDTSRGVQNIIVTDWLLYVNANQTDGTVIPVDGSNIKIEGTILSIQGKASGSSYVTKAVNAYSIKDGKIEFNSFNLGAGESAKITVKISFNKQYDGEIKNYARLAVNNNTTTTLRTADADYIKMREYEVSLEKFISGVSNENSNVIDVNKYVNILTYLRNNKDKKLSDLISSYREISIEYAKYDLNNDGKVDKTDLSLYNSKNIEGIQDKIDNISNYVKADLNGDGVVNATDRNIYLIMKSDLNNDKYLNENDRYMYIIKSLFDSNYLNEDVLNYLYIQNLLIREDKTVSELKNEISSYVKSDVNNDGYVTDKDNYRILNNKLIINNNEEYSLNITDFIRNLKESDISTLEKFINNYDLNEDGVIDSLDIEILTEYNNRENENSKYYYIGKQDYRLKEYKDDFIKYFTLESVNNENYDLACDLNNDNKIYFDDYTFAEELYEFNKNDDYLNLLKNLEEKLFKSSDNTYDLNNDGNSDYQDYKILKEYSILKSKLNSISITISTLQNIINNYSIYDKDSNNCDFSKYDINVIQIFKGWKLYDEKYNEKNFGNYIVYDINNDNLVNDSDIEFIEQYSSQVNNNNISKILNSEDIENFILTFENNMKNTDYIRNISIDTSAIENYDTLKNIIDTLSSSANDVLLSDQIKDITGVSYEELNNQIGNEVKDLDINGDGKVDENDVYYLETINGIKDISQISGFNQSVITNNDLDEDGDWDNSDIELANEIKEVRDNEQIKQAIISTANHLNENETLGEREGKAEHKYDNNTSTNDDWKYKNVVTVEKGDIVTYIIKVTNDSKNTSVYISEVTDYLPDGIKYSNVEYNGGQYNQTTDNGIKFINLAGTLLKPGESASFTVTVEVIEPNMSVEIMKNTATITGMQNKNHKDVVDSTPNNNTDSDYFQMKDITIAGTVWNDVAWDKAQKDYNGIYDNEKGKDKLVNSSIDVYLYRVEQGQEPEIVGRTYTNSKNGQYSFSKDNLNYVSDQARKYIKGPQESSTEKRWNGTYYSYYVVFEYDGVTYTSTKFADVTSNNSLDSNAREKLDGNEFDGYVNKNRTDFNNGFNTINNESGIEYTTKNESGYIPQSIHEYNPSTMAIQSSTKLISLSKTEALEQQLKHVNLGLRGRDTFDLKLATDVYSTQVTVNEVPGVYQYNNNKVTLRRGDLSNNYNYVEDAANIYSESSEYVENKDENSYDQDVRKTDIKNENYGSTGLEIQVTYKITVQNVSSTDGTATKITDYYDDKYTFVRAYGDNNQTLSTSSSTTGTGYKSVVITTPSTNLTTTAGGTSTMNIYIVYKLKDAVNTLLNSIPVDGKISLPTFNIAEITEYKTQCAKGQTQYTRGLLDINSAPGSIDKEQARLITTEGQNTPTIVEKPTVDGKRTTVEYYFEKARAYLNDRESIELNDLKYEDDTSAAPILYFTSSDSERTITGTVFEDKTTTNPTTRIKTGNGKLDKGKEVGVYGATVELVELKNDKDPQYIGENEGTVRYTVPTKEDGTFTISGFLPGNYVIRYRYGDTTNTVLLHQGGENINKQSYNGEDYQSTNNAFEVKDTNGNIISNILDRSKGNLWYVMNKDKGISTATDNSTERTKVSDYVTGFTDEKMKVLNNMRDMIGTYDKNDDTLTANKKYNINKTEIVKIPETKVSGIRDIIKDTKMYATTPQMLFTVEQTINLNELGDKKQALIDSNEIIVNSTYSDLGEWAMFPDANNEHYKSYIIENMNFGIAEVPVTTIDLQKTVQAFNLTDSTGKNTIASAVKNNSGKWELKGAVYNYPGAFDVSVEDEKLQGARLQVTYAITSKIDVEKNFDGKEEVYATITELVDYIDNNLSYNPALGENSKYWELTTYNDIFTDDRKGTVDPEGKKYTTIVKAKSGNPILNSNGGTATITLEKVLSSTDSTIEEIITSTVDTFAYNNTIEITKLDYDNYKDPDPDPTPPDDEDPIPPRDRVRTPDRYIILPGVQHDSVTAEVITIHPPTGDSSINIIYYVIAAVSLVILAAGVFGIKKFVLKK